MKLPLPFFQNNKEEKSEYYFALIFTDEKVTAVLLQESLGVLKILNHHEEFFRLSIEDIGLEDLISTVDKAISRTEEVLPPDVQTNKTVFGVKDTWVEEETKKITKDQLAKLKKICDALDLTPIGFMVVSEAISHLLQKEEGAPLSAILAEIGKKQVTLTLFRGGKAAERIDGPLGDSAHATVDTLLKHFTATVLPARIIIYDGKDIEGLSQEFISHQWSKSLPFLHVPQVTTLPAGFDAKAVSFGAATQMGFEVSGLALKPHNLEVAKTDESEEMIKNNDESSDYIPSKRLKRPVEDEPTEDDQNEGEPIDEEQKDEPEKKIPSDSNEPPINGDNFGFVTDQDITTTKPLPKLHTTHHEIETEEPEKSDFSINRHQEEAYEEPARNASPARSAASAADGYSDAGGGKLAGLLPFAFFSKLHLPKLSFPALTGNRKFILPVGILIGIIVFIIGFSTYYYNNVKAHIILAVEPKIVDQEENVIFDGTAASDFSQNIIAAKPIETTVDGSLTINTTGKKDVGDKAKGTVTVYNSSTGSVKLENGTQIRSSNGLIFLLDKEITVASASGDIFSGTKPGTADVAVTARDIGTESNLPSGTKFTIGNNSSLAAKNDSAFSGGSKKQVQVVSRNDVSKLRNDLPKSLEAKARDAISQETDGDLTLLPLISIVRLEKEKFDNDVDDEATKVTLTATVRFSALAYENEELNTYVKSLLKEKYSQDISDKSIKNTINDPEETEDGQVEAKLAIEAGLLPDINTEDILRRVENKSLGDAKKILNGLPQIASSQVTFSPGIPLIPNLFPKLPNQISIEIKPE